MNAVAVIMLVFAGLGAVDRIIGNKIGIGKEFEKGIKLVGELVLSMLGMIIIAPVLANLMAPFFNFVYHSLKIEPSILPAILFANDMGGAPLAKEIAQNADLGMFNGMVVASMMGATVSFTIPLALGCLKKEKHGELMLGLLCGVVTIPVGCFAGGLICGIPVLPLFFDLLPLIIFSVLTAIGLWLIPKICVNIFTVLGFLIKILVTIGLVLGLIELLIGVKPIESAGNALDAAGICLNAAAVLSGALPLLFLLSKILAKPMGMLGNRLKINSQSTLGFLSTLASNVSTFEMMNEMDQKGTVLNSAFAVSASFLLADHLAFTLAFDQSYLLPMMIAKITSGLLALFFAVLIYKRANKISDREEGR